MALDREKILQQAREKKNEYKEKIQKHDKSLKDLEKAAKQYSKKPTKANLSVLLEIINKMIDMGVE